MILGQHSISDCNYLNRRRVSMSEYKNKEIIKKRRKIFIGCKQKSENFEKKKNVGQLKFRFKLSLNPLKILSWLTLST